MVDLWASAFAAEDVSKFIKIVEPILAGGLNIPEVDSKETPYSAGPVRSQPGTGGLLGLLKVQSLYG